MRRGYSAIEIALHWLVAILVTFNYFYSDGMGRALAARAKGIATPPVAFEPLVHVWVGMAVLALVVVRLMLRGLYGAPAMPGTGWLYSAATWGHRLLYLLLVLATALGLVAWFGAMRTVGDVHKVVANVLVIVAGAHALMALWHQFVIKDGLLIRMLKPK